MSLVALRMHFVAGILDRAGAHPAPDQHNVFGRRVVEAVPAAARRIDHVAFARRLVAMIGVDHALALEHDEKLVAIVVAMVYMPRTWLKARSSQPRDWHRWISCRSEIAP